MVCLNLRLCRPPSRHGPQQMTESLLVGAAFGLGELASTSMELQGHLRAFIGRTPEPLKDGGDGGDGFSFHKKEKRRQGL